MEMEMVLEPDMYCPILDASSNYIDKIPNLCVLKRGIQCPCGARQGKVYQSYATFLAHTKTKTHQKWLNELNSNRTNFYVENQELRATVASQRLIIANLEKDVLLKIQTIDCLTKSIVSATSGPTANLLDFD
jgi:hypothetical protein